MMETHDPFDLWAMPRFGRIKSAWYRGSVVAKLILIGTYALDWFFPHALRRLARTPRHDFAHVHAWLRNTTLRSPDSSFVGRMAEMRRDAAWGLPFAWYSINKIYPPGTPLITSTPYIMEALLEVDEGEDEKREALALFQDTWDFLESLRVRASDSDRLALSYAPAEETNTVVNANSYSAWAYAMHATHGLEERRATARNKALRLVNWVVEQQNDDGSWFYLAERGPWDMVDGFHSCFVVRNLRSAARLVPESATVSDDAIRRGWEYIRSHLYEERSGLCRRYSVRHRLDPFRYDIYDQAEYLGLLVDFGELDEAQALTEATEARFRSGADWYCRIDVLGRRWGKNFIRWGIAPYWHHKARLESAMTARTE